MDRFLRVETTVNPKAMWLIPHVSRAGLWCHMVPSPLPWLPWCQVNRSRLRRSTSSISTWSQLVMRTTPRSGGVFLGKRRFGLEQTIIKGMVVNPCIYWDLLISIIRIPSMEWMLWVSIFLMKWGAKELRKEFPIRENGS